MKRTPLYFSDEQLQLIGTAINEFITACIHSETGSNEENKKFGKILTKIYMEQHKRLKKENEK